MTGNLQIRSANLNDVEELLNLYQHLIPDEERCATPVAQTNFNQFLKYEGSAILLGEVDGRLVSTCAIVIIPNLTRGGAPYALTENVVTHVNYRARGFGKKMLDAASQRAWNKDCYKVMLMTGSKKPSTLDFYIDAGFEQTKTGFQKRLILERKE